MNERSKNRENERESREWREENNRGYGKQRRRLSSRQRAINKKRIVRKEEKAELESGYRWRREQRMKKER